MEPIRGVFFQCGLPSQFAMYEAEADLNTAASIRRIDLLDDRSRHVPGE
jgi:hypothetical protein